ncbi:MAG: NAD(P)/FAD-dependent oxidoreductase [Phycisphaerales bacterium]
MRPSERAYRRSEARRLPRMSEHDVIIIGAGLAGLCCARVLAKQQRGVLVLEAADVAGGRVRTDVVDGFRLDRGFQVLLTSYPEAREVLDFKALRLHEFYPGAMVRCAGKFHKVADPRRKPLDAAKGFLSPVATLADKARLAVFEQRLRLGGDDACWSRPEKPALDLLRDAGFAPLTIDRFFRPFFGGVFLDRELDVSSRMFEFLFRLFGQGRAALPEQGMGAIPAQLAAALPAGSIRLNATVKSCDATSVTLDTGEKLSARAVVIATDADAARTLLPGAPSRPSKWRATSTLWYSCGTPPVNEPILFLNGEDAGTEDGPVNSVAMSSVVCPAYAPAGAHLMSVSVIDQAAAAWPTAKLDAACRAHLAAWFGPSVSSWRLLRHHFIPHALPQHRPGDLEPARRPVETASGVFICGDHVDNASINGAMESGRRAADAVLENLGVKP